MGTLGKTWKWKSPPSPSLRRRWRERSLKLSLEGRNPFQNIELQNKARKLAAKVNRRKGKLGIHPFQQPHNIAKVIERTRKRNAKELQEGTHPFQRPDVRAKIVRHIRAYNCRMSELGLHQFQRPEHREWARQMMLNNRYRIRRPTMLEEILGNYLVQEVGISLMDIVREFRIGDFVVDFYCASRKLAFEADGKYWHKDQLRDEWRSKFIEVLGTCVIHFDEEFLLAWLKKWRSSNDS